MLFLALATVPRQLSRFAAAICRAFQAVSMVQLHGATALRVDIEDLARVNSSLTPNCSSARAIADQPANFGELAPPVDRRDGIACRQR
jgi:hypothetical protein